METTDVASPRHLGSLTVKVRDGLKIVSSLPKRIKRKESKWNCCCLRKREEDLARIEESETDVETTSQRCFKCLEDSCDSWEDLCAYIVVTIVVILAWCLVSAVPCAMIAIGGLGLHSCTVQAYIPVYLIVGGSVFLVATITVFLVGTCVMLRDDDEVFESETSVLTAGCVFVVWALFIIGWTIAGSYWVYSSYSTYQHQNSTMPHFCDERTYKFSFWILNSFYIILGLCSSIGCCCCCKYFCCEDCCDFCECCCDCDCCDD